MNIPNVSWEETSRGFRYWSEKQGESTELSDAILSADIVLLPNEGFRDYKGFVFPVGTEELFAQLKKRLPEEILVDVAVSDDEYREVAVHSDLVAIAEFLVTKVAAQILVCFLVDYLKQRLRWRFDRTNVKATLVIEDNDGRRHRTVRMTFEGPAPEFESAMKESIDAFHRGPNGNAPTDEHGHPEVDEPTSNES